MNKTRALLGYARRDRVLARQFMEETGIEELRRRHLATLSGGQLQRVPLARALAGQPEILVFDEPTANIDMRAEDDISDLLKELNKRLSITLVSHDIGFISGYVRRVACLNRTLMCHQTEQLDGQLIRDLYPGSMRAIHHMHNHNH